VIGWWDTALYCDPDPVSVREAEERMRAEMASCVVRHARRDHSQWWAQIDAKQRQAAPRLRLVTGRER
jgi:hypothetical protein